MLRIEIVQLGDLKTGDKIAVMGEVADLHSSLLPLMDHTNGIYFHHGIFDKEMGGKWPPWRYQAQCQAEEAPHPWIYRLIYEECPSEDEDIKMKMANEAVEKHNNWLG